MMVMSAQMVEKLLSVTTKSILPVGGPNPGGGGAKCESTISFAVGSCFFFFEN